MNLHKNFRLLQVKFAIQKIQRKTFWEDILPSISQVRETIYTIKVLTCIETTASNITVVLHSLYPFLNPILTVNIPWWLKWYILKQTHWQLYTERSIKQRKMLHLSIKSLLINEKEEFLILRLYIFNNLNLLTNTECISSVYKGGTICRPPSFWHGSFVISFSGNYFLNWAPNHHWVVELSFCVQRNLGLMSL